MADKRDRFESTDHDPTDLAALAHALYESDAFKADLRGCIQDVLEQHAWAMHDVDLATVAAAEFEEQLLSNGTGGLFLLRNGLVPVGDLDLAKGDTIWMQSACDKSKIIEYELLTEPRPDSVRVWAAKIAEYQGGERTPVDGHPGTHFSAGELKHSDRFAIEQHRATEHEQA